MNKTQQSGVSILMALVLVALLSALMVGIALMGNYTIRRSQVITHLSQAQAYNKGVFDYAKRVLMLDGYRSNEDTLAEDWAMKMPAYPVDGGQVSGHINELSSRFNFANLHLPNAFEEKVFKRLWEQLGGSLSQADSIITLVRSRQYFSVLGVLMAADLPMDVMNAVVPYFVYLPNNAEKLNINTVSPQVFAAYLGLSLARAKEILSHRLDEPIVNQTALGDFANRHDIGQITTSEQSTGVSVIESRFGVKSRYFQVVGEATVGDTKSVIVVNLAREVDNIVVLSQRLSKLPSE